MKKFSLSIAAMLVAGGSAAAADLPARHAAVAPAPIFVSSNWTGFYLGFQVGHVWENTRGSVFNGAGGLVGTGRIKPDGMLVGVHAGYNRQSGALVYGVEADAELSFVKKNDLPTGGPRSEENWRGSLRGRLGYAFDRTLVYATGGLAVRDRDFTFDNGLGVLFTKSGARFGWTVGAGDEHAFSRSWSVRAEYRYSDFGTHRYTVPAAFAPIVTTRLDATDHSVRLGVSYRFGAASGPVVARY